jgi:hypothetical protein
MQGRASGFKLRPLLQVLLGAARGLEHMHAKNLLHGAVTYGNVRVDDNGFAKLVNFRRFIDLTSTDM